MKSLGRLQGGRGFVGIGEKQLLSNLLLDRRRRVELAGLLIGDADTERLFEELTRLQALTAGEAFGLYGGLALG